MTLFAVRVFLFSILPLLLSAGILLLDRSANTCDRRVEIPLVMLFGLGVAGSGIASFFGHYFLSDIVAESIGWPSGSPFQLDMAFSNLALGILGLEPPAVGTVSGRQPSSLSPCSDWVLPSSISRTCSPLATLPRATQSRSSPT